MRHPGVEKHKKNDEKRSTNESSGKNKRASRTGKKHEDKTTDGGISTAVSHLQKSTKKLTLADTKPKKGEVSTINLRDKTID